MLQVTLLLKFLKPIGQQLIKSLPIIILIVAVVFIGYNVHNSGKRLGTMETQLNQQGEEIKQLSDLVKDMKSLTMSVNEIRDKQLELTHKLDVDYNREKEEANVETANNHDAVVNGGIRLSIPLSSGGKVPAAESGN